MSNVISFTLKDIGMFVLWSLIIVILYYFIVILKSLYSSVKEINGLISKNQDNVDKILKEAPGITKNANAISKEVADTLVKFRSSVDNIAESSESATKTLKENDTINKQIASFFQTISLLKDLFNKYIKGEKNNEKNN